MSFEVKVDALAFRGWSRTVEVLALRGISLAGRCCLGQHHLTVSFLSDPRNSSSSSFNLPVRKRVSSARLGSPSRFYVELDGNPLFSFSPDLICVTNRGLGNDTGCAGTKDTRTVRRRADGDQQARPTSRANIGDRGPTIIPVFPSRSCVDFPM